MIDWQEKDESIKTRETGEIYSQENIGENRRNI